MLNNKKIGLISGCFWHLHSGHFHILSKIKESCNYLVVCLNNDSYLSKKKGQEIISFDQRKSDLIKTSLVDEVIEINDSPIEVIKAIHPAEIWVGSDYTKETTVGYPECLEWGGDVKIIQRLPNLSTTEILAREENDELTDCFIGKLMLKQRQ